MIPKVGSPSGAKKGKSGGSKGKSSKKSSKKKSSTKKKQKKSSKKKKKKKRKKKKKKWGKFFTKARKLKNSLSKSKLVKRAKKAIKKAILTTKKVVKKAKAAVTKAKQQVKAAVKQTKQVVKEKVLPVVKKAAQATTKAVKNAVKPKNLLNTLQVGLDLVGLIPGFGEIADRVNGIIYLARGDKVNAALSFGAMIPFAGWAATGGKLVNKGAGVVKSVAEGVQNVLKGPVGSVVDQVKKQVVNVKTQIQSKVAEVKQQLRQMVQSQQQNFALAGGDVRHIEDTGTVGRNTPTPSPKPSNTQPSQNGSNKKPAEDKGTGKVSRQKQVEVAKDFAREQLDEHVKFLKNGGIKKPIDENGFGGGKYKPDVISAAVDITRVDGKKTKITFGYNGAREGQFNPSVMELHPDLGKIAQGTRKKAKNDPKNPYKDDESFEIWHVENCAEIQAVNQLLWSGSKIDDILISTINGNGKYKAPCKNCQETFLDFINDFRE
ncbi:hypothetical protein [Lysinibacillus sphaericus]|uniref:hypothetical protein n=1 Tax=Lysinibacillus sphaericus TaxID=1421 RepID=UPI002DBE3D49|nr:hypothetical protein [Lysinibacillus sphaericus]MEB7453645.1 hypothetical protein [Lysinibacillus sphaericus]